MRLITISVLLVLLAMATIGFLFRSSNEPVPGEPLSTTTAPEIQDLPKNADEKKAVPEYGTADLLDKPGCLTFSQLESLPALLQDAQRMESVSSSGPALDSYASFDGATLQGFVDQGDSAAMVIMGARAVMRAYATNESMALEWLNARHQIHDLLVPGSQLSPTAGLALNDAAYWFYEAALHGRLFALEQHGVIRSRLFGGPVGLGWIGQEDYDALDVTERGWLHPANVYQEVAYDLAPQLKEGILGSLSYRIPESDLLRDIRRRLVADFNQSLLDSDLPAISLPATASGAAEILNQVCDSVKREQLGRHNLE